MRLHCSFRCIFRFIQSSQRRTILFRSLPRLGIFQSSSPKYFSSILFSKVLSSRSYFSILLSLFSWPPAVPLIPCLIFLSSLNLPGRSLPRRITVIDCALLGKIDVRAISDSTAFYTETYPSLFYLVIYLFINLYRYVWDSRRQIFRILDNWIITSFYSTLHKIQNGIHGRNK